MPGDQTLLRDNMLARMEMATPGGSRWPYVPQREPPPPPVLAPEPEPAHKAFDEAQAYATGRNAFTAIFTTALPSPSRISLELAERADRARQALNRGERVVLMAGDEELAIFEPTPGAVLAACLRREYAAAGRVTETMLAAARSFLPDVDPEALRLSIESALAVEHRQHSSKV